MNKLVMISACLFTFSSIQAKEPESKYVPVFLKGVTGEYFNVSDAKKAWVFDNRNGVYFIYFEIPTGNNMYYKAYSSHLDAEMDMHRLLKVVK